VGDDGCEYMTGGRVVGLGPTGRNFGAGMSGGIAYVWDGWGRFASNLNREMVDLDPLDDDDHAALRDAVTRHAAETASTVATSLLADWDAAVQRFSKIMPRDYKRVLEAAKAAQTQGIDIDEAIMAAAHG
jgi:glutamate synthase (NADPH/NADH) large chain